MYGGKVKKAQFRYLDKGLRKKKNSVYSSLRSFGYGESISEYGKKKSSLLCFSLLGPKSRGYGGMVDATDSIGSSLGVETDRVTAPRFRGTQDFFAGNPEPNLTSAK
jgi:hypothetical protein